MWKNTCGHFVQFAFLWCFILFFSLLPFPDFSDLDYIALICEFCLLFLGDTLTLDSLPRLLIASNARISPRIIVTVYSMSALPFLAFCQAISSYIVVYASSLYISPLYSSATLQSLICDFSLGTICTRNLQAVTVLSFPAMDEEYIWHHTLICWLGIQL